MNEQKLLLIYQIIAKCQEEYFQAIQRRTNEGELKNFQMRFGILDSYLSWKSEPAIEKVSIDFNHLTPEQIRLRFILIHAPNSYFLKVSNIYDFSSNWDILGSASFLHTIHWQGYSQTIEKLIEGRENSPELDCQNDKPEYEQLKQRLFQEFHKILTSVYDGEKFNNYVSN